MNKCIICEKNLGNTYFLRLKERRTCIFIHVLTIVIVKWRKNGG